jgi:hypothetical protein
MVAAFYFYQLHKAKEAGKEEGKQQVAQQVKSDSEKELSQDRKDYLAKLNESNTFLKQAQNDLKASEAREKALQTVIVNISQQKAAAADKLSKTPDSGLHAMNVQAMNLRDPGDQAPGYLAIEERAIAKCLTVDRPACEADDQARKQDVRELRQQVANLEGQVKEWDKKFDDLGKYAGQVETEYTRIFNVFPNKGNRLVALITLGHKGRPKKLPFPDPKDLLNGKKDGKQ